MKVIIYSIQRVYIMFWLFGLLLNSCVPKSQSDYPSGIYKKYFMDYIGLPTTKKRRIANCYYHRRPDSLVIEDGYNELANKLISDDDKLTRLLTSVNWTGHLEDYPSMFNNAIDDDEKYALSSGLVWLIYTQHQVIYSKSNNTGIDDTSLKLLNLYVCPLSKKIKDKNIASTIDSVCSNHLNIKYMYLSMSYTDEMNVDMQAKYNNYIKGENCK